MGFMAPRSLQELRRHEREAIRPAPTLGQNTGEILGEVQGFTGAEIREMRDAGTVA